MNLELRQQLEAAELRMPLINAQIAQLVGIELIAETALLGEVVYDQAYSQPGAEGGSLVLQAALLVPGGLGLVAWDREEYCSFRRHAGPGFRDVRPKFVQFEELGSALKVLLLPHAEVLLDRLLHVIGSDSGNPPPSAHEGTHLPLTPSIGTLNDPGSQTYRLRGGAGRGL